MLQSVLEQIPGVQVVGSVFSGEKALEFIARSPPDLITLDIEMPGISGLETLREIARRNVQAKPLPPVDTILVSALTKTGSMVAVEGLQLGALDFVCKPSAASEQANRDSLRSSIEQKLAVVRQRRFGIRSRGNAGVIPRPAASGIPPDCTDIIGPLPSVHQREVRRRWEFCCRRWRSDAACRSSSCSTFWKDSAVIWRRVCRESAVVRVVEAENDLVVQPGSIYLAKSGRHMLVRSDSGVARIGLSDSPPEKGCRPAANVFLPVCCDRLRQSSGNGDTDRHGRRWCRWSANRETSRWLCHCSGRSQQRRLGNASCRSGNRCRR